jgi:hypothetical protein
MANATVDYDPSQISRISSGEELKDLKKQLNIALVLVEYRISQLNKGHYSKMTPNAQHAIKTRFGLTVNDPSQYEEIRKQLLNTSQKLRASIKGELYTLHTRPQNSTFFKDNNLKNNHLYGYTNVGDKSRPNMIGLSNAYFNSGIIGNNTKAGTLIHELSHQSRNGRSEDVDAAYYGEGGSENLNNRYGAYASLHHADSLEFYYEDASQSDYVRNRLGIGSNVPRL